MQGKHETEDLHLCNNNYINVIPRFRSYLVVYKREPIIDELASIPHTGGAVVQEELAAGHGQYTISVKEINPTPDDDPGTAVPEQWHMCPRWSWPVPVCVLRGV